MNLPPSYLIIGERKCGTSSLYRYLIQHPNVLPCRLKEPQFFSKPLEYIEQNIKEYFQLFPSIEYNGNLSFEWPELNEEGVLYHETVTVERKKAVKYITGEASANVFHEVDPALIHHYLPNIKLILLFRNPIDRAYSHHRMYQRFMEEGREGFKVRGFEEDMRAEIKAFEAGERTEFITPSAYIQNLEKWLKVFPIQQFRIFSTEDLANPNTAQTIMNELTDWLEIPNYDYGDFLKKRFNQAPTSSISPTFRQYLEDFFEPYHKAFLKRIKWTEQNL